MNKFEYSFYFADNVVSYNMIKENFDFMGG